MNGREKAKVKKEIREYNIEFFTYLIVGFFIVTILTLILEGANDSIKHCEFKTSYRTFEIISTIINLLSVLLGFILVALGIIISNVRNRYQSANRTSEQRIHLNQYWKYLIGTSKPMIFLLIGYILLFVICLAKLPEFSRIYDSERILLTWVILSTIKIFYIVFDRIFDYYENPFD